MPTYLKGEKGAKYQLGRTLGSGVSCKVKLAKDENNERVAVKIMSKDIDFGELMAAELETLRQCAHPNVIGLIESGKGVQENSKKGDKTVHYIILELAQGGELFDFIALGGRFPEPVTRLYAKQLCEALSFMHKAGVCHRDLKPENLMLDANYNLKVADFGFAAPTAGRDGKGKLTTQLGTASYMAPEIHLGKPYEGPAVDVLATGIILFVMITQRPPFSQASHDDPHYRLLIGKRADLFWSAHEEAEGEDIYSKEFKSLFEGMLAFNPKERFTMDQVLAHPFFAGETKTIEAIKADFDHRKSVVDQEAHTSREEKRANRATRTADKGKVRRGIKLGDPAVRAQAREQWGLLEVKDFDFRSGTQFFTSAQNVIDVFEELVEWLDGDEKPEGEEVKEQKVYRKASPYEVDSEKLRIKYELEVVDDDYEEDEEQKSEPEKTTLIITAQVLKVDDTTHCMDFTLKKYKDNDGEHEIIACEARDKFLRHFHALTKVEPIKNYIDAAL